MPSTEERKGPTPNGGVRSRIYYTDAGRHPVDKEVATHGVVVEYDAAGIEIARTEFSITPNRSLV